MYTYSYVSDSVDSHEPVTMASLAERGQAQAHVLRHCKVYSAQGALVPPQSLPEVFAVFFGSATCPATRAFLPSLVRFYEGVRAEGEAIEIVYVYFDRTEVSFAEMRALMPWPAVDFLDKGTPSDLRKKVGLRCASARRSAKRIFGRTCPDALLGTFHWGCSAPLRSIQNGADRTFPSLLPLQWVVLHRHRAVVWPTPPCEPSPPLPRTQLQVKSLPTVVVITAKGDVVVQNARPDIERLGVPAFQQWLV